MEGLIFSSRVKESLPDSNDVYTLHTATRATLRGQIDTSGLTTLYLPGKAGLISACSPAYIGWISQEFQMRAAGPDEAGSGYGSWHSLVHDLNPK